MNGTAREMERYERAANVVTRRVAGELVLVPKDARTADARVRGANLYVLNETGAMLWERLASAPSVEEMARSLIDTYDLSREEAVKDVQVYVADLLAIGAIVRSGRS